MQWNMIALNLEMQISLISHPEHAKATRQRKNLQPLWKTLNKHNNNKK